MAGMLPGVECARRRRFHQSRDAPTSAAHNWTRRSSFCLYATNNDNYFHTSSIPSLKARSILQMASEDEKLGGVAREAKERLDEKLRSKRKSDDTIKRRQNSKERVVVMGSNGELQTEVYGAKKSSRVKKFNWAKVLMWKGAGDQDECTICLDRFKTGQSLMHLPCAHRYHPRCLVPWLETNAHCPCCRLEIHVQFS